jgi:hypothetical protein
MLTNSTNDAANNRNTTLQMNNCIESITITTTKAAEYQTTQNTQDCS